MRQLSEELRKNIRSNEESKIVHNKFVPEEILPPFSLSVEAQKIWDLILPMLDRSGLYASVDAFALSRYCDLTVLFNQFKEFVQNQGVSYSVPNKKSTIWSEEDGKYIVDENATRARSLHPEAKELNKLSAQLLALEKEFGMTKVSRSRLFGNRAGTSQMIGDPFNYET